MKKLIISATTREVKPLLKLAEKKTEHLFKLTPYIDILITGVGIFQTIYLMMNHLNNNHYDQLINVGIAGSYLPELKAGIVVQVVTDTFGDFGVDDNGQFITAWDAPLLDKNAFPFEYGWLNNSKKIDMIIPQVKGITVQKTSGSLSLIEERKNRFSPGVETMESAAFFFVALQKKIQFVAIRSISNMVEPRNKKNWHIDLAVENLNKYLKHKLSDFF